MSETVGQHSVAAFTSPVNGTSPIDANTVKGNDNTLRSAYVDHDADPGIHVQSSTLASRPVANSAGRKWMTQDSGVIRLFYDDGTSWYEVDYLRTTGGTISGNLAVTGTLAVTGVATFTAQPVLSSLTASQAVFTDASKGLVSNAITGTGSVVMSASPTLTGTITAAAATLSGALGVSGLLTFASLKGTGTTTVTNILDEDNMASDSATALATQQSIKAYVDAQVGASDALSEVLAIGNTTGANDIIVSAGQKIRTPAVAAQDGSSAITIANTTGALTLATGLADSNLATISTAGKVSNSATTATSANTASAIVARDASGNFTAGTVTAALSGNASTATTLQTARTINGVSFNGSADITVTAAAGTLTGSTLASGVTASSLTSVGTLANLTVTNPISGSVTGSSGSTTGNAATATALQTARSINGVSFNGTADITVTAAAGTLSGSTLASGVTASSLTSVGTLTSLTVSGDLTVDTNTLKVNSSTDKVGIGTTSMVSKLDVRLSGTSSGGVVGVGNAGTGDFGGLGISDGGTYPVELWGSSLSFKTGNSAYASATEKMVLTSAGNLAVDTNTLYVDATNNRVGIGTASPGVRLDVNDTAVVARLRSTSTTAANEPVLKFFHDGNDEFAIGGGDGLRFYGSGTNLRMTLTSAGNLGIGVTPSAWTSFSNALQIKTGTGAGAFAGSSADNFRMFANTYYDGAYKRFGAGYATQYEQAAGTHVWYTAGTSTANSSITFTQAMTLDASGKLDVGVGARFYSSGSNWMEFSANVLTSNQNDGAHIRAVLSEVSVPTYSFKGDQDTGIYTPGANILAITTGGTERARITSGGDFLVQQTSSTDTPATGFALLGNSGGSLIGIGHANGTANATSYATFAYNGTRIGWIEQDSTTTVKYNTSSDRRLKENVAPAGEAGSIIDAISIVSFDWKDGAHARFGIIAQDEYDTVPEAISVGDDEDVEELRHPWSVDYSKLVPMLVKEIQSLRARVAVLEA